MQYVGSEVGPTGCAEPTDVQLGVSSSDTPPHKPWDSATEVVIGFATVSQTARRYGPMWWNKTGRSVSSQWESVKEALYDNLHCSEYWLHHGL
jgi:hypothetical protein